MNDTIKRLLIWAGVVAVLYAASMFFEAEDFSGPRRPMPPEEEGGAWLNKPPAEPPAGRTPTVPSMDLTVENSSADGEDVIGTAFLVAPNVWVTAAHVLEECAAGYVRIQGRWRKVSGSKKHPVADVALLTTDAPEKPPTLGITDRPPVMDQDGFHIGL